MNSFRNLPIPAIFVMLPLVAACEKEKPAPVGVASATASPQPAAVEEAFEFPDPESVPLPRVGDWVDRARSRLPANEVGKIDAWLKKAVRMTVEVRGESKKTLLETGDLTCGYDQKMVCSFPGKLAERAKHFVASTVVCVDKNGVGIDRSDWKIEPNTRRGEALQLPVDDGLLRGCWDSGGVSLRMEVVGSPCVVPFPRQIRCAGEYNTCLHRCKSMESCEQICDRNRRNCLAICK